MFNTFPQILSVFPQLLDYGFYAPLILRLALGLVFLNLAYQVGWGSLKGEMANFLVRFPRFKPAWLWTSLTVIKALIFSILLIIGLFTQIMAILVILSGIKIIILREIYHVSFGFETTSAILMIAMGQALLIAGPGALAIDLPL